MVYDPSRNLLFIHIPKNAGKSIGLSLGLISFEEDQRSGRSLLNKFFRYGLKKTKPSLPSKKLYGTYDYVLSSQHLTYLEMKLLGFLDDKQAEKSFKFSICRNPWSRAVSIYNHMSSQTNPDVNFDEFCEQWFNDKSIIPSFIRQDHNRLAFRRTQSEFIVDKYNQVAVDMIIKYENLAKDYQSLCNKLGVENSKLRYFEKIKSPKKIRSNYRDYYSEKSKKIIQAFFEEDIDRFGYKF